jgi:hypothetical protein
MSEKLKIHHTDDRSIEHAAHVRNAARGGKFPHIDPRAGGLPKGGDIYVAHGHKIPVADGASPLDPTVQGKRQPPCMVQIAGATFNGADILKEAKE